ncbi:hypothetical protein SAMN05880582_10883 [Rhizobium sp. RU20A]|uniref:acyl-CoA/acyl-ACP dehydrogenase n=1 Tax=Rhizobium sp. RU20A TaxID=1907412 RepID=UPI000953D2D6|nr:acyl-CoA/acyl-ACP dehydrogenase [Rhizobium sp. RU20A]SIR23118.1 hypothetical protein SAMN05880582_10883 [Rhizobium sp. RU20A]
MGVITQLNERLKAIPLALVTDDEVRAAIESVAEVPVDDAGDDGVGDLIDWITGRGLLALSVPADDGGGDLSNDLIAELFTALALRSEAAALRAASHFVALEQVRTSGSAEQRRSIHQLVLRGERLAHAGFIAALPCETDRIGLTLSLPLMSLPVMEQDWTVFPVSDEDRRGIALVPSAAVEAGSTTVGLHLPRDQFLASGPQTDVCAHAVATLLDAASLVGTLQAKTRPRTDDDPQAGDVMSVHIEWLRAMVTRLATAIDGIQVGASTLTIGDMRQTARALESLIGTARGNTPR